MANVRLLFFAIALAGCSPTLAEEETVDSTTLVREPRTLLKKKLCRKYGICEGYGGYGQGGQSGYGGYPGHQGYQGYQGYQGHQGYQPPINIAISQSQSSANQGGGGHGSGYHPNNYQYNGGYPNPGYPNHGYHNQGYNQGYPNQGYPNQGYNQGYPNQGYNGNSGYDGYRPGFSNGNGGYNSQFNGNYFSGTPTGGYGFQGPYGNRYDHDGEGNEYNEGDYNENGEPGVKTKSQLQN